MRRKILLGLLPLVAVGIVLVPLRAASVVDGRLLFEDVRSRIEGGAVDSLSPDEVWVRAARGLVGELNDPYAELFSPEQIASFSRNTLRNDYAGVGMNIQDQLGTIVVTATFPGSPAAVAGVRPGDRILEVDGQTTTGQAVDITMPRRPWPLPALYGSATFLHACDTYLSLSALNAGALELNPVLKPFTNHPVAFIAVKAGLTAASIAGAEQMWKHDHRAKAVVLMMLTNAMMVGITAHNAAVLQTFR